MPEYTSSYPDILGQITGGARLTVGMVECAAAVRPQVVGAGLSFAAVLLLQNVSDASIAVTAVVQPPAYDAHKKPDRFTAHNRRLKIRLRPAEVGYVVMPLASLPDTTPYSHYKLHIAVSAKTQIRPQRLRVAQHSTAHGIDTRYDFYLSPENADRLAALKRLAFSVRRRSLRRGVIEVPFGIMREPVGAVGDVKPAWVSLWALGDAADMRALLARHSEALRTRVLPRLNPQPSYAPLFEATFRRFRAAGYALRRAETHYVTKLLVYVLKLASMAPASDVLTADKIFHVAALLEDQDRTHGAFVALPHWCRGLLHMLSLDSRLADDPLSALSGPLYDDLLRDAMMVGFEAIQSALGEALGSRDDMRAYTGQFIEMLYRSDTPLTFVDVYLPLALAGILVADQTAVPGERSGVMLKRFRALLKRLGAPQTGSAAIVLRLADKIIARAQT